MSRWISVLWRWPVVRELRHLSRWGRFFLTLQIIVVFICAALWKHLPPPGWAVAILAFVAAAMSVHGDMRGWQRAVWMALIGVLLVIELRAISKDRMESHEQALSDRKAQDLAFQEVLKAQDKDFAATSQSLKDAYSRSQQQFDATMKAADRVLERSAQAANTAREAVNYITGGDSWAWVKVVHNPASPENVLNLAIISEGKYPLHDVRLIVLDMSASFGATMSRCPVGDVPAHYNFLVLPCTIKIDPKTTNTFAILIQAANGQVTEDVTFDEKTRALKGAVRRSTPDGKNQVLKTL